MKRRSIFLLTAGLILLTGLQACAGMPAESPPAEEGPAAAPMPTAASTATANLPPATQAATASPAIPEQRRLTLEWPPVIRAGDSDVVRLTLEMDAEGNLRPTAEIEGHEVGGEVVSVPDLYATHHVIAEARLDMAGVQVLPAETVSEPLLPGQSVTFYWSVSPAEAGDFRGTVWLYLRFIPKAGGEEARQTISSQLIEIEARKLLGMSAGRVRVVGTVGSFIGAVLGFPFVDDLFKWLWKRIKR